MHEVKWLTCLDNRNKWHCFTGCHSKFAQKFLCLLVAKNTIDHSKSATLLIGYISILRTIGLGEMPMLGFSPKDVPSLLSHGQDLVCEQLFQFGSYTSRFIAINTMIDNHDTPQLRTNIGFIASNMIHTIVCNSNFGREVRWGFTSW